MCTNDLVIGADFYLMERICGQVFRDEELAESADSTHRERIGEQLVETLAAILTVEYD